MNAAPRRTVECDRCPAKVHPEARVLIGYSGAFVCRTCAQAEVAVLEERGRREGFTPTHNPEVLLFATEGRKFARDALRNVLSGQTVVPAGVSA
jgi:hypothetical protein